MLNKVKKCYFCGDPSHEARDCPIYKKLAPRMKTCIGTWCEDFFAKNYKCFRCKNKSYSVLNNRSPSLDVVCKTCGNRCEIKSKCYSGKEIAEDIFLHHGSYEDYLKRQNNGLDMVIIIYKIIRQTNTLVIREILYFPNKYINKKEIIKVHPKYNSNLSEIIIPNRKDPRIIRLPIFSQLKRYNLKNLFNFI